jgi:transcriptional regulator with XRE-family HTH domain
MKSKELVDYIKAIMREKVFTQHELAQALGISQPAVSLYLQGRMPPADVLLRLARLGGTTVEKLLSGKAQKSVDGVVRETPPPYGNGQALLELWDQLPPNIQRDMLRLMRDIISQTNLNG